MAIHSGSTEININYKYFTSYSQACDYPEYVGDGKCDKDLNNDVCQFDGGDCGFDTQYSWPDINYDYGDYDDYYYAQVKDPNEKVVELPPVIDYGDLDVGGYSDYDKDYAQYRDENAEYVEKYSASSSSNVKDEYEDYENY